MNKRERVLAAFRGEETDHVPVCMWKHVPMEYRADDDLFAECQVSAGDVFQAGEVQHKLRDSPEGGRGGHL